MREQWIIGICNSGLDGVCFTSFCGTQDEAKMKLIEMVQDDRREDDTYEHGTEIPEEVSVEYGGALYAYGNYYDHHIDYSAKSLKDII